ncbi:hypothetical protein D187_006349 [Cystobacter fuscus DSM 2262]|uniref:Uncharacterized protein n=1 Tax=Cystobacter fuscus (strain ATCC 25194 / DSM 2262 / NBRC 100088 / M29) TaxID=1242864 RepID=S9QNQ2_CYSF2|nr:hypothetical protein D187_006349 [Cystobacter fuscus DSM 2262]
MAAHATGQQRSQRHGQQCLPRHGSLLCGVAPASPLRGDIGGGI